MLALKQSAVRQKQKNGSRSLFTTEIYPKNYGIKSDLFIKKNLIDYCTIVLLWFIGFK